MINKQIQTFTSGTFTIRNLLSHLLKQREATAFIDSFILPDFICKEQCLGFCLKKVCMAENNINSNVFGIIISNIIKEIVSSYLLEHFIIIMILYPELSFT